MSAPPPGFLEDLAPSMITKYKPRRFSEFHFSTNVSFLGVIEAVLKMNRIHALFISAPNTCKTTFLETFIRDYFCFSEDGSNREMSRQKWSENIMYINSLKEQGISYHRNELKTFCQTYSTIPGRKKVVIIDDVDFVNEQCQQVFRNYIDRYGHNVHFVATCSSVQKVVNSMQSRLLFVHLPPLLPANLHEILQSISHKERLYIEPAAREYLVSLSSCSFRCLLNYLEKIRIILAPPRKEESTSPPPTRVSLAFCENICTDIHPKIFDEYMVFVKAGNFSKALKLLFSLYNNGFSVLDILDNIFLFIKHPISSQSLNESDKYKLIPILCKYIKIFHTLHEDKIELAFFANNCLSQFTELQKGVC